MATVYSAAQRTAPGALVSLYRLDTTKIGGGLFYFVQGKFGETNEKIAFQGIEYQPCDIEFEGLEVTGQGAFPTPVIRISNTDAIVQSIVSTWGDLEGCEVRRIRTFEQFLDDGSSPDPQAFFGADVFIVERKTTENQIYIEWELSTAIDQEGKMLPGRQVIRDTCMWRYRAHISGTTFNYERVKCPYTGTDYFDKNNEPTTAENDRCSRTIKGCELRFGEGNPLPFGGFPGVARVRM